MQFSLGTQIRRKKISSDLRLAITYIVTLHEYDITLVQLQPKHQGLSGQKLTCAILDVCKRPISYLFSLVECLA